ncbi:MAG: cytochrome c3 family protein [Nitrospirota bacterium]
MKPLKTFIYISFFLLVFIQAAVTEGGIDDTKHNLSVTGPGPIRSATEDRVCIFCHAPDSSGEKSSYLWNKRLSRAHYIPYESSTLYARVGQPTGSSKLCLSCHDGTIALGELKSAREEIPFAGGIRFIPEGPTRIGTDLSDDHPVSFVYNSSLVIRNGELANPLTLPRKVRLDKEMQMQCTTCHDPHNNSYGNFLVMPNSYSDLCTTCHHKRGWTSTSHSSSNAVWNGASPDPWPTGEYGSVAENGCENCHVPHNAAKPERLLNFPYEEDNCLVCHNGNVADLDIGKELAKPFMHAVQEYSGIHDPGEDFTLNKAGKRKHVECSDCHNPHQSNADKSPGPPQVSGALNGVAGIDLSGQKVLSATKEYEICFKCHGDFNTVEVEPISRDLQQLNTRLEFDPSNPSYHPVVAHGANEDVPSLFPEFTTSSVIFCTDCHNNEDSEGPRGPHGSRNEYLLERNYTTQDFTQENAFNYALCYKCHERNSILGNESFSSHSKHIVDESTPCSACHDPHGISATQGNSTNNTHLINFDLTIVQQDSQGRLEFEDTGVFSGRCSLLCHGNTHDQKEYP